MRASEIKIGETYALRLKTGELVRVRVDSIVTTRTENGPSGLASTVYGTIWAEDVPGGDDTASWSGEPKRLLGQWDKYQQLVDRQEREKARRAAERRETELERATLVLMLASVGIEVARKGFGIRIEEGHYKALHDALLHKVAQMPDAEAVEEVADL